MENKLTDNEIKKALECCLLTYGKRCEGCPYEKHKPYVISTKTCSDKMRKDVLDYINRLEANVEMLREIRDLCHTTILEKSEQIRKLKISDASKEECTIRQHGEIKKLKAEIKRLSELEQGCYVTGYKNIRAAAVKEFAEKAKEELAEWVGADSSITYSRIEKVLDNLVKETMEDSDCNLEVTPKERAECKCPDGCPGTLTTYEQIEMGIKK